MTESNKRTPLFQSLESQIWTTEFLDFVHRMVL
jgi:hypothetical protein